MNDLLTAAANRSINYLTGIQTRAVAPTPDAVAGLAAARHEVLRRAGWNVEAQGLFSAPPITVVLGAEAHPSVTKSLGLLGLGRSRVVTVPVDGQGRMQPVRPQIR